MHAIMGSLYSSVFRIIDKFNIYNFMIYGKVKTGHSVQLHAQPIRQLNKQLKNINYILYNNLK